MLTRLGLVIVILACAVTSQAQNYGLLSNGLANSNQKQIDTVASRLEDGLGRSLTPEEYQELTSAVQTNPLVRVVKHQRTYAETLYCLGFAVSPILGTIGGGVCASSSSDESYLVTLIGPALQLGFSMRVSVIKYEGIQGSSIEGIYQNGLLIELAWWGGLHGGSFSNDPGSKRILVSGLSLGFHGGVSGNAGIPKDLGFEIVRLR